MKRAILSPKRYALLCCYVVVQAFMGIATAESSSIDVGTEGSEAKRWLERMSVSLQKLNYEGVFVYRRGEDLSAMSVTHLVGQEGEQESLVTLTGVERNVTRKNSQFGDALGASAHQIVDRLADVENHYHLNLAGPDRIAGRPAQRIMVSPKDQYRYGYRLWVDDNTGLLLKSELFDAQSQILEQVMFTSLRVLPDQVESGRSHELHYDEASNVRASHVAPQNTNWLSAELPAGFQLVQSKPISSQNNVEHMVYTDGLASVSVFVESAEADGANSFVGLSRMGAVNAYGQVYGGYQVTVVGEVPDVTVKLIGQSIQLRESGASD